MNQRKEFEERTLLLNGRRVKVIVPLKTITKDEFTRNVYEVFRKYIES